tara:strand:- start:138471 stop:138845 length:375 start_codon:yes stop_codon:yes gene_type:complete
VIAIGVERHHDRVGRRAKPSSFPIATTFAARRWTTISIAFAAWWRTTISITFGASSLTVARTISAARRLSNHDRADHRGHSQNYQTNTKLFHRRLLLEQKIAAVLRSAQLELLPQTCGDLYGIE